MKIFWKNAISDNFSNAVDWSTGNVPGNAAIAMLTVAGSYVVTADSNHTVLGLATGTNTTLNITGDSTFTVTEGTPIGANRGLIPVADGSTLQVGGLFNNTSEIGLGANGHATTLAITAAGATLQGGGTVLMTDDFHNQIVGSTLSAISTLTNVDNTISGAGTHWIDTATPDKSKTWRY